MVWDVIVDGITKVSHCQSDRNNGIILLIGLAIETHRFRLPNTAKPEYTSFGNFLNIETGHHNLWFRSWVFLQQTFLVCSLCCSNDFPIIFQSCQPKTLRYFERDFDGDLVLDSKILIFQDAPRFPKFIFRTLLSSHHPPFII